MIKKKRLLQAVLVFVCLLFISKYFSKHIQEFQKLLSIGTQDIFSILLLSLLIHFIAAYKTLLLLRALKPNVISFGPWVQIYTASRFLNFHVTQAANVYRGVVLKKEYEFPYTKAIGLMTLFGWAELVFIFFISTVMIAFFAPSLKMGGVQALVLFPVCIVLALVAPLVLKSLLTKVAFRSEYLNWVKTKCKELTDYHVANMMNAGVMIKFLSLSFISFSLYILAICVAFDAIGIKLGLVESGVFTIIILLGSVINITPNNVGILELLYGGLSHMFGWTLGDGILACSILRVLNYLLVAGLTLVWRPKAYTSNNG